MHFRTILLLLAALTSTTLLAAAERIFTVTGVVEAKLDNGDVVIQHAAIPDYMPAMTMAFTPAQPAEATALKVGDAVRFRYRVGEERSVIESIFVTGQTKIPAKAEATPTRIQRVKAGDPVPPFQLIDETGQPFTKQTLHDQYTVMTFIFTRCPVPEFCPAMALKFGELQATIRADSILKKTVRLVSVTLDPTFDQPEVLTAYGQAIGAKPDTWGFATGDEKEAIALARAFSVYMERDGAVLNHTLCTALVGPDGKVLEIWRGNFWKSSDVIEAIQGLLKNQK